RVADELAQTPMSTVHGESANHDSCHLCRICVLLEPAREKSRELFAVLDASSTASSSQGRRCYDAPPAGTDDNRPAEAVHGSPVRPVGTYEGEQERSAPVRDKTRSETVRH